MPWSRGTDTAGRAVWRCTRYTDLNYAEINNLAEYGTPMSPYQSCFPHEFIPDFAHVQIEMPQTEVMNNGFGQLVNARSFALVQRFLTASLSIPFGTYSFDDLVRLGFATRADRTYTTNLYTTPAPGGISAADAAYIYGTVGFAIMRTSRFSYTANARDVEVQIGALDDNWDFESSTGIARLLNPFVAALAGPDHYNLEAPIRIHYTGPGRTFREHEAVRAGAWFRGFSWF